MRSFRRLFSAIPVQVLLLLAGLMLLVWAWHWGYTQVVRHSSYRGDIFRPGLADCHMPFYLLTEYAKANTMWVYAVAAVAALVVWWFPGSGGLMAVVWCMLALCFAYSESPERLYGLSSHYQTFAADLSHFSGIQDVMQHYTQRQHLLDVHGQHYPPGNLLLFMASRKVDWLALPKLLSLACCAACLLWLHRRKVPPFVVALVAFSPAMLVYPSLDLVGIPALLSLLCFTWLKQALSEPGKTWWLLLGLGLFVFCLLSFTVAIWVLFAACFLLFHNAYWQPWLLLKGVAEAVAVFVAAGVLLWLVSGFSLADCFFQSVAGNHRLMGTTGFDTGLRYLLRSTGNLLGIFYTCGFAGLLLVCNAGRQGRVWLLTAVLASFSGLFFGETERIFVFMVPLISFEKMPGKWQQLLFIYTAVGFAVWQEIFFRHWL